MAKYIENLVSDKVDLDVYECECGFHLGIDNSYLEQVEDVKITCPSCGLMFETREDYGKDSF